MASIRKEIIINAPPEQVWEALRDYGAVHERVAPGFLVDCKLDGDTRVVTFSNGLVAREMLVDIDDGARRLVYTAASGSLTHHNASAQVFPDGDGVTLYVWIADILPNAAAQTVAAMMDAGAQAMKRTLESATAAVV